MATSLPVLKADELMTLQRGQAKPGGNVALIAAGTGLGEAVLHHIGRRYVPLASEGGHTDFAARTDREIDFVAISATATDARRSSTCCRAPAC